MNGKDFKVTMNGAVLGTYRPTRRLIAYGGGGDDTITIKGTTTLSAWLDGGDGNDRLISSSGSDELRGASGNDLLKGAAGNDLILGGLGDDLLKGSTGRDLLIGGLGVDQVFGQEDDDLLIGGRTAFDDDRDALSLIFAEWTSTRSFGARKKNLSGTGQGTRLNGNNFLQADITVFSDGLANVLDGSSGKNWLFL